MPGVITTTSARAGAGSTPSNLASRGFLAGLLHKGPASAAKKCGSYAEFVAWFGPPQSYTVLHDQVATAFAEGATELYIVRAVGPSATKGTLTLVDRAGSPVNTIRLDAIGAGAWSSSLTAAVANGEVTNTVTVTLTYAAGTADEQIEVYRNVGPDPAAICARINGASKLVTAVNLSSATASPDNRPAVLAATALSAGDDDRTNASATVIANAMVEATPKQLGPGVMAIPGYSDDTSAVLVPHCVTTKREAYFGPASSAESVSSAKASAALITALAGAHHGAYLYPFVQIPNGLGGTTAIDPCGAMIGARARVIEADGEWSLVAGSKAAFRSVVGVAADLSDTDVNDLHNNRVVPIRAVAGTARPYGYRSLSTDDSYYWLSFQAVLNAISHEADLELEDIVLETIDSYGVAVARMESRLKGICERKAVRGGMYSRNGDKGYQVEVVPNPVARRIEGVVSVRPPEAAEVIAVSIVKVAVDSTL